MTINQSLETLLINFLGIGEEDEVTLFIHRIFMECLSRKHHEESFSKI